MALIDEILDRVGLHSPEQETSVHHECRHCGKTVSDGETSCPACGSSDIAEIPL